MIDGEEADINGDGAVTMRMRTVRMRMRTRMRMKGWTNSQSLGSFQMFIWQKPSVSIIITTDILNMDTHLPTDRRAPPSVIAEVTQVPHFEDLICKFLQHQLDLNLWTLMATSVSSHPLWPSILLQVIFVVFTVWPENVYMHLTLILPLL